MQIRKYLMALSVATMAVTPALAAPVNPAASLSIGSKSVRVASPKGKSGFLPLILIALVAVAAAGAAVAAVASSDSPDSN